MDHSTLVYLSFVIYLLIINFVAYFLYKRDKRNAKDKQRRIPEFWLLLIAWLGGALGSWYSMYHNYHKTHHWQFVIGVPLAFFLWLIPVVSTTLVYSLRKGQIPTTVFMMHRSWSAWSEDEVYLSSYDWVDYDEISPTLTRAVIASEDNLFLQHHGFSKRGMRQAWQEHVEKGTIKHGGSTISQQTAKNVFTLGKRTYLRKVREAWYTVLLETFWSKRRIMEVYLNVIEMGDGIWGAEAASRAYFHHSAKKLTSSESALIAACLPNPRRYSALRPGPYVQRRQQQILNLMPKMGPINLN